MRSLTGLIELNQVEERTLGVDTSFWIAIALTYLEFLEEREVNRSLECFQVPSLTIVSSQSYLAATSD